MVKLLYGSGLRLMECLRLRVKDLDFSQQQIIVRDGKGQKDRVTMLPESLVPLLQEHIRHVRHIHEEDLSKGYGSVYLPFALERKYPNASREWLWQYVFPASRLSTGPRTAGRLLHLGERFGHVRLEAASRRAWRYEDPGYSTIKRILEQGLDQEALPETTAAPVAHTFVRATAELVGHLLGGAPNMLPV